MFGTTWPAQYPFAIGPDQVCVEIDGHPVRSVKYSHSSRMRKRNYTVRPAQASFEAQSGWFSEYSVFLNPDKRWLTASAVFLFFCFIYLLLFVVYFFLASYFCSLALFLLVSTTVQWDGRTTLAGLIQPAGHSPVAPVTCSRVHGIWSNFAKHGVERGSTEENVLRGNGEAPTQVLPVSWKLLGVMCNSASLKPFAIQACGAGAQAILNGWSQKQKNVWW